METVLLVIHMLVTLALIGVILVQKSEGGALGIGGGAGGGFMTARGTANLLTRTTGILAALFIALSLVLAILSERSGQGTSIFDQPAAVQPVETPQPEAPAEPAGPAAPVAQ